MGFCLSREKYIKNILYLSNNTISREDLDDIFDETDCNLFIVR